MLIRVWMPPVVRKEVTSIGTFLSTLCHEFCHHLDLQKFSFPDFGRNRGFYDRSGSALLLCERNTSEACVLDAVTRRPLANQLATDQPR
jgi:hypothetical protein